MHLSVCRQFSPGQLNQLRYEYIASRNLEGAEWTTIGYHAGAITDPFIRRIPWPFRVLFLRNLYGWCVALHLSKRYDVLVMRHITFDPFALIFSFFIRNRVSVHHSKEVEELKLVRPGWRGQLASVFERYVGRVAVKNTKMILGVTEEIARYEQDTRDCTKPIAVYPNGIDTESIDLLDDKRRDNEINVAFICGTFSHWHGLDKLIDAAERYKPSVESLPIFIHLIGQLSQEQLKVIYSLNYVGLHINACGVMRFDEYRTILDKCDFGIGSLALERKSLTEAATLKVREMLALGLPVYSGHNDVALMNSYSWARVVSEVDFLDLQRFGVLMKRDSRQAVRSESSPFIEKREIMRRTVTSLKSVFGSS